MEKKINILLVDDHKMLVEGLKGLLDTQPAFSVDAANNANEALRYCHDSTEIDLILMDINLSPDGPNGLELTRQIKQDFPKIKVLICSMHEEITYIQHAKRVGANGYINKKASGRETVQAINEVMKDNESWPLDSLRVAPIQEPPTPTELEVLKFIAKGMSTAKVGIELAMLEPTVSAHRHNIIQKYRLNTTGELTNFANACMSLYGIPHDPDLSTQLDKLTRKFKADTGIAVKYESETGNFNNATNRAILRVVEEALRNIKQHASASNISIELKQLRFSWITLTISDDGKGFDVDQISRLKKGIDALRRILAATGGELAVNSSCNIGTTVIATLRRTTQY